jgi:hypothetical protein
MAGERLNSLFRALRLVHSRLDYLCMTPFG